MENYKEYTTKDGQFGCSCCKGTGNSALKDGDPCPCCEGTGYLVVYLSHQFNHERHHHEDTQKQLRYYKDFVKQTSTCKTCGGNAHKTWGGGKCKECGLIGEMPWPG
jgi:RecJ-like exonuclease